MLLSPHNMRKLDIYLIW